jgi:hypothetical protein
MVQNLVDFSEKYTKISFFFSLHFRPEPGPQVCSTTDSAPRVTQSSAEKGTRYTVHVNTEKRERKEEYNHERNCETDLKYKN